MNPTLSDPFRLPPITRDGLTYEVEFTSTTSGTIRIYGHVSGGIRVDSLSALWKEGTIRPDIPFMGSGCNAGFGAAVLLLAALALAGVFKKRT